MGITPAEEDERRSEVPETPESDYTVLSSKSLVTRNGPNSTESFPEETISCEELKSDRTIESSVTDPMKRSSIDSANTLSGENTISNQNGHIESEEKVNVTNEQVVVGTGEYEDSIAEFPNIINITVMTLSTEDIEMTYSPEESQNPRDESVLKTKNHSTASPSETSTGEGCTRVGEGEQIESTVESSNTDMVEDVEIASTEDKLDESESKMERLTSSPSEGSEFSCSTAEECTQVREGEQMEPTVESSNTEFAGDLEMALREEEIDESESKTKPSVALSETSDYFSVAGGQEDSMSADFSSGASDDLNLAGLSKEVIEEERKFAVETELELKTNSNISLDLKEREKRYKTLMSLLGKSKEYANYMSQKLLTTNRESMEETAEPASDVLQNATNSERASRKRKGPIINNGTSKKAKVEHEQPAYDTKTHYKNEMGLVVSRRQPSLLSGGIMRDYQLDGLEWMVALYKSGVNGILADEMGLGKTIQVISLLCHLREKRIYGPHLIIGPLSTLPNWLCEFANFAPEVPVALYHGPEEKRDAVMEQFVLAFTQKKRDEMPIIITSYEMPLRNKKFLSAVKWCSIIVDEGHRLKNYKSMLTQELKRYKAEYRLLLTGTPLQNNISELWGLLNYLIPEIFDNLEMFENVFDFSDLRNSQKQEELIQREKEEKIISKMHEILEPFLLRRVKADVNIDLPAKKEILVKSPLTPEQEELYKSVLDKSIVNFAEQKETVDEEPLDGKRKKRSCATNRKYSENWDIDEDTDYLPLMLALPTSQSKKKRLVSKNGKIEYVFDIKLTNPSMMLRKIVNHPYLVKTPVVPGTREIIIDENLIKQSGKLLVLDALLPKLKADGHKVLIFSTFKIMLDLIEDYAIMRNHKYVRLDGETKIETRLEGIKQFNNDPSTFVYLISTRAGGLGINLTGADTVIIFNSDWNPQVDLQAQDRCHRIGQSRPVVVYRLVTAGTIDEHITNTAVGKRRLEKLIVKKGKFKKQAATGEQQFDLGELKELLESTDYKQVIHPNGLVLSDEEIDRLLDRSDLLDNSENSVAQPTPGTPKVDAKSPKAGKSARKNRRRKF